MFLQFYFICLKLAVIVFGNKYELGQSPVGTFYTFPPHIVDQILKSIPTGHRYILNFDSGNPDEYTTFQFPQIPFDNQVARIELYNYVNTSKGAVQDKLRRLRLEPGEEMPPDYETEVKSNEIYPVIEATTECAKSHVRVRCRQIGPYNIYEMSTDKAKEILADSKIRATGRPHALFSFVAPRRQERSLFEPLGRFIPLQNGASLLDQRLVTHFNNWPPMFDATEKQEWRKIYKAMMGVEPECRDFIFSQIDSKTVDKLENEIGRNKVHKTVRQSSLERKTKTQ